MRESESERKKEEMKSFCREKKERRVMRNVKRCGR